VPGYERNAHAARTLLGLMEQHVPLDPAMLTAVRDVLALAEARSVPGDR
jgi:hypothetical protein